MIPKGIQSVYREFKPQFPLANSLQLRCLSGDMHTLGTRPRVCAERVKGVREGVLQFNRYMDYIKYNHRAWLVFGVVLGGEGCEWLGRGEGER